MGESFFDLLHKDEIGDGKSISWDGETATFLEDPLDSNNIEDGGGVIEGTTTVTVGDVFEYTYPDNLKEMEVINDSEEDYKIQAKNFGIQFEQVDYQKAIDELNADDQFELVEDKVLSEYQTKYFKEYQLYQGIITTDQGDYVGYVLVFDSALADRQYKITCGGTGMWEEIKVIAFEIMNHFDVLFY